MQHEDNDSQQFPSLEAAVVRDLDPEEDESSDKGEARSQPALSYSDVSTVQDVEPIAAKLIPPVTTVPGFACKSTHTGGT